MSADRCCDLSVKTTSSEETFRLGRLIGENTSGPCTLGLLGDLGAGKTVFIQGLARGLGVPEKYSVTSPTYTIVNQYPGRMTLFHADLYRLQDPGEISETGLEEILSSGQVVAIEWAEHLPEDAPQPDILIRIEAPDADTRLFSLFFYGPAAPDLVDAIKKFGFP
ncbi:MAG: tRNA (adenosine(37)-N6)-threonylcarbamoyltransferase complex ATPase subunit type 1 TsaE, partial [Desulfosalsimonas sp.]